VEGAGRGREEGRRNKCEVIKIPLKKPLRTGAAKRGDVEAASKNTLM
jgi:hypothetical protein